MSTESVKSHPDLADSIARSIADILRPHLARAAEPRRQQIADTRRDRSVSAHEEARRAPTSLDDELAVFDELVARARVALESLDSRGVVHSLRDLTARFGFTALQPYGDSGLTHGLAGLIANERAVDVAFFGVGAPAESVSPSPSETINASELGELFSVVAAEYLRLRGQDREDGMRGQTIDQNKATFRMFVEVNGDLPFNSITRKDTGAFLEVLEQLPALYSKSPAWRGMTLQQIAAAPKSKGTAMLAKKTQARHFAALGGLFKHLISRKGFAGANPARGFGLKPKRKARSERPAWTPEDLAKLFASPVWMGCVSERQRSTPGDNIYRNAMYWLPILCVFHGARLEEFAQLRRRDVKKDGEIWYFNVTDEAEGQLKNEQSRRQVPVHPFVAEIGFLDWLGNPSQNRDALVFSELSPSGADGKFGQTITKKFCRYRRELRLGAKDVVFHSLRHSVVTALIRADAPQVLRREITGHKQQGEDEGRYFKGSDMCGLLRTISLVRWPRAEAVLREASSRICSPLLELPAIDEA
jgi:integrase